MDATKVTTPAERAVSWLFPPLLARSETPAEHCRNALAILSPLLLVLPRDQAEFVAAAVDRIWKAVEQLEGRAA